MIAIIDYGMGNLRSVQKGLERVGGDARIVSNPADVAAADQVVLPGVGAFRDAIAHLRDANLDQGRMLAVSPDNDSPPKQMSQFDDQYAWKSACLTPDHKWYIAVSEN